MESRNDFRISHASAHGMNDEELFWAVIEPIWPDAEVKDELTRIAEGTAGQRAIYATTLFAREVDNGGLAQFFGNSSGMYAKYVEEGLRLLEARELLDAFLEALAIFPGGEVPINREVRRKLMDDSMSGNRQIFDRLDQRLYQDSGVEEQLYPYFKRYIDAHQTEFFSD